MTRFEFLVWELKRKKEIAERFLELNVDPDAADDSEDVKYEMKVFANAERWLKDALIDKPLWERAVTEFESERFDKSKLRAPGYLKREND